MRTDERVRVACIGFSMHLTFKFDSEHISLGLADAFDHGRGRLAPLAVIAKYSNDACVGVFDRRLWG